MPFDYAAKRRGFDKPTGLLGNYALHAALHVLGAREREMVRRLIHDHDLPLAVIAPYRKEHPLLAKLDPFVHQQCGQERYAQYPAQCRRIAQCSR